MNALSGPTDAELVARVLQADREAFAVVYDRYGPRLYDFAYSMLRHREDASDAVADSFVTFAEKLPQLREPDRLRPWLYAIVRSECLRKLKARKRVSYGDDEQLMAMPDDSITPEQSAEQAMLTQLVWDAAAGLADRDRALLDLHLRQGLDGAELGEAMGVSAANAYVMLNRLRAQVDRSLGALLIARLGRDECDELDALLVDWDGSFSPLIRKRVARHVDGCEICGERRKKILSPWMLLAGVPVFVAPLTLRDRVLNDTQLVAYSGTPSTTSGWSNRTKGAAAAAAFVAAASVTAAVAWPEGGANDSPVSAAPTISASSAPTSAAPSTAPSASASSKPSPSASATASDLPAELTASTTAINLGRSGRRGTVTVGNSGDLPLSFTATENARWLRVAPTSGTLEGGRSVPLTVRATRSGLPEGTTASTVVIRSDAGSFTVRVSLVEEHDPTVGPITTPTNPSCTLPVSVGVTDESRLTSVRLTWSGPMSGSTAMAFRDGRWRYTIDPISVGGSYTLKVVARDARGNTTTRTRTLDVNPCPG